MLWLLQDPRYCRLTEEVGSGANGAVQAWTTCVLPGAVFKTGGNQAAIEHEAGILRQVQHPNIVAGYGTMWGPKRADGSRTLYLAMERLSYSMDARLSDLT